MYILIFINKTIRKRSGINAKMDFIIKNIYTKSKVQNLVPNFEMVI